MPDAEVSLEGVVADFAATVSDLDGSLASSSEGMENASAQQLQAATELTEAAMLMLQAARSIPGEVTVSVRDREVA